MSEIHHFQINLELIDDETATQFRDLVLELRGKLAALFDYADQPVSFFYLHFVCLLSAMYLPLFAVQTGVDAGTGDEAYWLNDIVSGLIVVLQGIFVIGLRQLAEKVSEPFGEDLEDLSVMHYVNFTWLMSRRILEAELPSKDKRRYEIEEQLLREQQPIGDAWWTASNSSSSSSSS